MMRVGDSARQRLYSAGNIAARLYEAGALPVEVQVEIELTSMLRILGTAYDVLCRADSAQWINDVSGDSAADVPPASLPKFIPRNSTNYTVELQAGTQVKASLHEAVVNDVARYAKGCGWAVESQHPIDLVLRRADEVHLVEVKIVRGDNALDSVRADTGQVSTYRSQLFRPAERAQVGLVAASSEDVGVELRELLTDELGIAVLWLDAKTWRGCQRAVSLGLIGAPGSGLRRHGRPIAAAGGAF